MLSATSISKSFNNKIIISNASFSLPQGSIIGLCGRNGSGKTTLIKLLLNIYEPDCGSIKSSIETRKAIFDMPPSLGNVSIKEYLDFFALLYRGTKLTVVERRELLDRCDLQSYEKKKFSQLSYGMKKLLYISTLLIGSTTLVIMDEPFNGLDEGAIEKVKKICNEIRRTQFSTILISSHQLDELEAFCDEFLLIRKGEVYSSKSTLCKSRIVKLITNATLMTEMFNKLSAFGNVQIIREGEYEIELYNSMESTDIIEFLIKADVVFTEIYYIKKSIFMEHPNET